MIHMMLVDIRNVPIGTEMAVVETGDPKDPGAHNYAKKMVLMFVHQRGQSSLTKQKYGSYFEFVDGGGLIGFADCTYGGHWSPIAVRPGNVLGTWEAHMSLEREAQAKRQKEDHERKVKQQSFEAQRDWLLSRYRAHGVSVHRPPQRPPEDKYSCYFETSYGQFEELVEYMDGLRQKSEMIELIVEELGLMPELTRRMAEMLRAEADEDAPGAQNLKQAV